MVSLKSQQQATVSKVNKYFHIKFINLILLQSCQRFSLVFGLNDVGFPHSKVFSVVALPMIKVSWFLDLLLLLLYLQLHLTI